MLKRVRTLAGVGVVLLPLAWTSIVTTGAAATPIEVDANSGSETNFDSSIVNTDLINQGRPSFVSVSATGSPSFPATGSNDATATHTNGLTFWGGAHAAGEDLIYTL